MNKTRTTALRTTQWTLGTAAAFASVSSAQGALVKLGDFTNIGTAIDLDNDGMDDFTAILRPSSLLLEVAGGTVAGRTAVGSMVRVGRQFFSSTTFGRISTVSAGVTFGAGNRSVMDAGSVSGTVQVTLSGGTIGVHEIFVSSITDVIALGNFVYDDENLTSASTLLDTYRAPRTFTAGEPGFAPIASAVPEPSSLTLLGLGAAGVMMRRKRRAAYGHSTHALKESH